MSKKRGNINYQNGIVIGNVEDKSNLQNPISRLLVDRFDKILFDFVKETCPHSIHEIGCGEGRITRKLARSFDIPIRASDFSSVLINELRTINLPNVNVVERNVFDLNEVEDRADLILCCEVLEHIENPNKAIEVLRTIEGRHYIFSVPREPLWCFLNMARGKYLRDLGNTPGHLNHWSRKSFLNFLKRYGFHIKRIVCPLPWIMVMGYFRS